MLLDNNSVLFVNVEWFHTYN